MQTDLSTDASRNMTTTHRRVHKTPDNILRDLLRRRGETIRPLEARGRRLTPPRDSGVQSKDKSVDGLCERVSLRIPPSAPGHFIEAPRRRIQQGSTVRRPLILIIQHRQAHARSLLDIRSIDRRCQ